MRKNRVTLICQHCGIEFEVQKYREREARFCSSSCRAKACLAPKFRGETKTCAVCGSEFYVPQGRAGSAKFCSGKCQSKGRSKRPRTSPETKTCRKCGVTKPAVEFHKRSTSPDGLRNECAECQRKKTRRWNEENTDRKADTGSKYYKENKGVIKEKHAEYYKKNKEACGARAKAWREAHREHEKDRKRRIREQNSESYRKSRKEEYLKNKAAYVARARYRKSRKIKATPDWVDRSAILKFYKEAAQLTDQTGLKHHVDHIVPLKGKRVCGLHVPWNLQVIPAEDNLKKSNMLDEDLAFAPIASE